MATRPTRDPSALRRLDATLELARDALDGEGVLELLDAAERILARQSERDSGAEERAA